jgi:ABC-2 type transport system ATP-binding protein
MNARDSVAIRTRSLEKRYGETVAVRSLDLDVHQGEVFGLLGPNGAGKTTTILMLLGLTERTSGSAEVVGLDPMRHPLEVKRHVGYLPDSVGFYGTMTARQNLYYTCRLNGIPTAETEDRVDRGLARVGLRGAADMRVDTYSRGMKQRLGLADALVKEPSVVILDEPTTAIDPTGVVETLELVRELAHDQGVAVLLSSHLLHQVQQVCDRIAIFVAGDVVAMGTVAELAQRQETGAHVTIQVGADGAPEDVASTLRAVPGVATVEEDEHDRRLWNVTGEPAIRARVAQGLVAAGHTPWHLRSRGMELGEIYERYFATSAPAEDVAARMLGEHLTPVIVSSPPPASTDELAHRPTGAEQQQPEAVETPDEDEATAGPERPRRPRGHRIYRAPRRRGPGDDSGGGRSDG